MVEKVEGATMTCRNCGTVLTCHQKTYDETDTFKAKTVMQWQNDDGTAHYKFLGEGKYNCNIPDEIIPQPQQTTIFTEQNHAIKSDTVIGPVEIFQKQLDRIEDKLDALLGNSKVDFEKANIRPITGIFKDTESLQD